MRRKESGAASIMDRYAIEFRSLKLVEVEILRNSFLLSSVTEESDEQNKNEQHLTKKEIVCMYCRTLKAVKYLIFEIIYVIATLFEKTSLPALQKMRYPPYLQRRRHIMP